MSRTGSVGVAAACLIFGWFSLMPDQFWKLGKHVVGGSLFSSNFVLLNESGYFDSDSAHKPLRHLWSLGIEEQYYLRMAPTFAPRSFASSGGR